MGWVLRSVPQTVKVTRELAKEFAEMDPAPEDRPLSERRLEVYRRLFAQGNFRPCTWARAHCKETSGVYRVNGKHTSTMLSSLAVLPDFYVTLEDYDCDTLTDVAKLYSTFDSKLQSRTSNDINVSFAGTIPELRPLNIKTLSTLIAGMAMHVWPTSHESKQPAERAELMFEHVDFMLWSNDILTGGTLPQSRGAKRRNSHLVRASVTAAMMGSYYKNKKDAAEFWAAVRDDTGETPDCPDRVLSRYLLTVSMNTGRGMRTGMKNVTSREVLVKCINAWNNWRRNERISYLSYRPDAKIPDYK